MDDHEVHFHRMKQVFEASMAIYDLLPRDCRDFLKREMISANELIMLSSDLEGLISAIRQLIRDEQPGSNAGSDLI